MNVERFRAIDLETNGVDIDVCEVGQVAIETCPVDDGRPDLSGCSSAMVYCAVKSMPEVAARINGLTVAKLAEYPVFGRKVRGVVKALIEPGTIIVTYNGARFDLPVIARYADAHGKLSAYIEDVPGAETRIRADHRDAFEDLFAARHVDVCRLWNVVRKRETVSPWGEKHYPIRIHSGMFAGGLTAAYGFYKGAGFSGAHDASVDNLAAVAVLRSMLDEDHFDLIEAMRLTSGPLPGDVDFGGVFKWDGDQAVCTLKKNRDAPIEKVDRGFLTWMLDREQSFHRHTKTIVRDFLAGRYPEREYENE